MAHRRWMIAFSVLTVLSIVPLFMFVSKNFLPTDDQSQFNVLVRDAGGHFAGCDDGADGAHRAGYTRSARRAAHTDYRWAAAQDKSVEQRHHLREADRHRSTRRRSRSI